MLALQYQKPGLIQIRDLPEPTLPEGGVVVRTAFAGVCGSDIRSWRHGNARLMGPQVLGHEVSGTIEKSDVAHLPVGMHVTVCPGMSCQRCAVCQRGGAVWCPHRLSLGYDLPGGMAERFSLPPLAVELGTIVPVPDSLSLRAASLAEPLHTVINGQDRAAIDSTDSVLVIGLGPIGTLHTAVARSRGASHVLGVDVLTERVQTAGKFLGSADVQVAPSDPDALRSLAPRDGWDVVVLAAGAAAAVDTAIQAVAPGGRILAFAGMPAAASAVPIDVNRLHYKQLSLVGAFGGSPATFLRAVDWLAESELAVDDLVTTTFPLEEAEDAFAHCERGVGLKTSIAVGGETFLLNGVV